MNLSRSLFFLALGICLQAHSFTETINTQNLKVVKANQKLNGQTFDSFAKSKFALSQEIGQASVPTMSYLLQAEPQDIQLKLSYTNPRELTSVKISPAQPEKCRCIDDLSNQRKFVFNTETYQKQQILVSKNYLGKYRGTPVTKVDVKLVNFNPSTQTLTTYDQVVVSSNVEKFNFETSANETRNFLILVPSGWESALAEFVEYKKSLGFNMIVDKIASPENTKAAIQAKIKKYFDAGSLQFTMIVGDERAIPMFALNTSSSSQTPSDLPYFTMDGATDHIPDVMSSRIVATTANLAKEQLEKIMSQEKSNTAGLGSARNIVGIASNEGDSPSDAEYITSINDSLVEKWHGNVSYFYQNNQNSNSTELNNALNAGAFWLTYVGHGSGYAWPSMNEYYSTEDIKGLHNADTTQPVIIDVACQNGRLLSDHLGSQFMSPNKTRAATNGAAAYFGGSVNISWHPPAIMARGIAFEHMNKNFNYLGEALLAGQLYLASKWTNTEDVIDNMEWYHLQGDPSFAIRY